MDKKNVLVIGAGIAGIQASLDLADRGFKVYLVEKTPSIGGRMAQLDKTFPTMDCSICILAPKMIDVSRHTNINLLTYSEVLSVSGEIGKYYVKILKKPRFVDEKKCIGCGLCVTKCPVKCPNEFDLDLGFRKAVYVPFPQAVPLKHCIDAENCLFIKKGVCKLCERFCESKAINFNQKEELIELKVDAIIIATGLDLFNPTEIKEYGYGRHKNVITAFQLERLVCSTGPTSGKLVKLTNKETPKKIAFIQCVGSRSLRKGHPYCSSVCCMYATKEAVLIKEHEPETEVYIFYTDLTTFGKGFREFVNRAKEVWDIKYIRARPGEIRENPKTKDLTFWYEDTLSGQMKELEVGLIVLCTALIPRIDNQKISKILGADLDKHGYFKTNYPLTRPVDTTKPGIFMCGCCEGPKDIPDSVTEASNAAARVAEAISSRRTR